MTFEQLNLDPRILEAMTKLNFSNPTEIQVAAYEPILTGKDVIARSHTGSGKTIAFLLPLFAKINVEKRENQVLILAPTHELVVQIESQAKLLAEASQIPVRTATIIGGANIEKQIKKLKEKPHIIVGTAGRVLELIKKKKIMAHTIKTIILDEADNLLDNTSFSTIEDIIKSTMRDRQLLTFSATLTDLTLQTAQEMMVDPVLVTMAEQNVVNPNIKHQYLCGDLRDKFELLRKLLVAEAPERAIVFVNQNFAMNDIADKLNYHQQETFIIRGTVSKEQRKQAIEKFRTGKIKLLVSSDLSARGLDIPEVTHVIHFDCPLQPNEYLHRAGRTARGTSHGQSICVITPKELSAIKKYEKQLGITFTEMKVSQGKLSEK